VVVSSCTPRTHAPLFKATCEAAGLNKYLFTFVNIREQCSWVHMQEKEKATEKAKDLVRMGVARARLLTPQTEERVPIKPVPLVVGGGVTGLNAALNLANQGFEVHLVEKENELGGFIKDMDTLWEGGTPADYLDPLIKQIDAHPKITVHLGHQLESVDGHIGEFKVGIKSASGTETVEVGTIILAIGAQEYIPHKFYGYDDNKKVVTLADFERMSKKGEIDNVRDVAFIQCVGARDQDKTYCSRICCNVAIKAAIHHAEKVAASGGGGGEAPKEGGGEQTGGRKRRSRRRRDGSSAESAPSGGGGRANITIFNRTINAYGVHHEINYNTSREKRIKYVKYDLDNLPKVSEAGDKVKIDYFVEALGGRRDMTVDMVVLSTPLVNHPEAADLGKLMKIPRGAEGFFLEAHVKLRPVEFATEGIYLAGTCRAPADITEAVMQAHAAASRAAIPMAIGFVQAEALTSCVNEELCVGCGTCTTVCAFNAIQLNENNKAETIMAACKGCGACASVCPQRAITMTHYSDEQLLSEVMACFEEVKE